MKTLQYVRELDKAYLPRPFYFNIRYLDILSVHEGGVIIDNHKNNISYNADDILLASTTVRGLQYMINTAVNYISEHGLYFNPVKINCLIKVEQLIMIKNVTLLGQK